MRYSLTREVFEYIKEKRSEGILAVELEEELGLSAAYILQLDKYATWEEYEEKLAIQRQKWHDSPKHNDYLERRRLRRAELRKLRGKPERKKRKEIVKPPKLPVYCSACGKLVKYAYTYHRTYFCSEECRKEARRQFERERYYRRMQDPEYVAKEKIRQHEKWLRLYKKKKEAKQ